MGVHDAASCPPIPQGVLLLPLPYDKSRGYYFSEDRIRTPIGVITVKAFTNS
jgi:hypothetical protein